MDGRRCIGLCGIRTSYSGGGEWRHSDIDERLVGKGAPTALVDG